MTRQQGVCKPRCRSHPRFNMSCGGSGRLAGVVGQGLADDPTRVILPGVKLAPLHIIKFRTQLHSQLFLRAGGHPSDLPDEPAQLRGILRNPLRPQNKHTDYEQNKELLHSNTEHVSIV